MLLLPLFVFLLATIALCSFPDIENQAILLDHDCEKLANNRICNADCLGFGSFETEDCREIEFGSWRNFSIIVNAFPIMHSMESWKALRETAERRFYRINLTINLTPTDYRNITDHCQKLKKERSVSDEQTYEYCPVEVRATFFVPRIESPEVTDFREECKSLDNNGVCDLMCRKFEGWNFEGNDCLSASIKRQPVFLLTSSTKRELLRPADIWFRRQEVWFRKHYGVQIITTNFHHLHSQYVREAMISDRKYSKRVVTSGYEYLENSTMAEEVKNWTCLAFNLEGKDFDRSNGDTDAHL